jgi:hypothetical protein
LYTTPVIYIFFDKLAQRFSPSSPEQEKDHEGGQEHGPEPGDAPAAPGPA